MHAKPRMHTTARIPTRVILTIVDDAFDRFFGGDPAFFTNIHPNSRCLALIADWEVEALQRQFGDRRIHASVL